MKLKSITFYIFCENHSLKLWTLFGQSFEEGFWSNKQRKIGVIIKEKSYWRPCAERQAGTSDPIKLKQINTVLMSTKK